MFHTVLRERVPTSRRCVGGGAHGAADRGDRRRRRRHRRGRRRPRARTRPPTVRVYTEFEDVGYSPCGIPYVHGKEIPTSSGCSSATRRPTSTQGIDIHYETGSPGSTPGARPSRCEGEGEVGYDKLIVATGFDYADPGVPGADLGGLYYVKNIRAGDGVGQGPRHGAAAVVVEASPLGLEMVTALRHRGIETHLIDPAPVGAVRGDRPGHRRAGAGVLGRRRASSSTSTRADGFVGDGHARAVRTSDGDIPADLAVVCTQKEANIRRAGAAGIKVGIDRRHHGRRADAHLRPERLGRGRLHRDSAQRHATSRSRACPGSHAYAQGKVAGTNAAGGLAGATTPVYVPWGMVAGQWMIGGGLVRRDARHGARASPTSSALPSGISRARYYPGVKKVRVKLLADPGIAAADRRPDGRRQGHQGARRLPRHGGQDRDHDRRPGHDGERLLAADRRAERAHRAGGAGLLAGWERLRCPFPTGSRANSEHVPAGRRPAPDGGQVRRPAAPPHASHGRAVLAPVFVPVYRLVPWGLRRPSCTRCRAATAEVEAEAQHRAARRSEARRPASVTHTNRQGGTRCRRQSHDRSRPRATTPLRHRGEDLRGHPGQPRREGVRLHPHRPVRGLGRPGQPAHLHPAGAQGLRRHHHPVRARRAAGVRAPAATRPSAARASPATWRSTSRSRR